jgi:hypothetical protein
MNDARRTFSLFLETSGPGLDADRARTRVGQAAVQKVWEEWSSRIIGPFVARDDVEAALGVPDRHGDDWIGYFLPLRSGYMYVFSFELTLGGQTWSGFRRLSAPPMCDGPPVQGVTEEELIRQYGEPTEREGWWPIECLTFAGELMVELRHGVLE